MIAAILLVFLSRLAASAGTYTGAMVPVAVLPVGIALVALAPRPVELHPKPESPPELPRLMRDEAGKRKKQSVAD